MAGIVKRRIIFPLSVSKQVVDLRIHIKGPQHWKDVSSILLEKIVGNTGILRIQVNQEVKFSRKIRKAELTEDFMKSFVVFFRFGELCTYDDMIFITFIEL